MDGIEVAGELASRQHHAVIVVSARDQEEQKVRALDRGAMDYVTKPFGHAELLARIRAGLRHLRERGSELSIFRFGEMTIDFRSSRVSLAGRAVELSPTEFKLLRCLVRGRGTIVRHDELLRDVWGPMAVHEVHYLRVYVKRLRTKLEADPASPVYILTEPSLGYRFGSS
jgi:two-component system KDP operon response regulator KdpE